MSLAPSAPAAVSGRCMQAASRAFLVARLVQASFIGWLDCVDFQETCQFEGAESVDERGKPGTAAQDGILGLQGCFAGEVGDESCCFLQGWDVAQPIPIRVWNMDIDGCACIPHLGHHVRAQGLE